jgi:hypothetical protein
MSAFLGRRPPARYSSLVRVGGRPTERPRHRQEQQRGPVDRGLYIRMALHSGHLSSRYF